ncbi:MAG TPA: glycosyltransferase family 39 protein, partial [Candidatus Tumulicola sp.]|nr:glycosyltransferase family 39 protein [Candidatus Tumulicola sp.]
MKLSRAAYALAAATVLLHLAFNHRYGYYRDEFYFIDCAKHLAWGYVDQPPLAPLLAWLTAPFGYALWALRLLPAILSGVTVLLACAIARELGGRGFAQALTAVAVATSLGLLGLSYGLSTEVLSPAAWSALAYLTIRLIETRDGRLYLPMALVVTVGMYAKYSIAACAIALAVGLLLCGHGRLLRSWWLVAGIAATALLTLPNVLWQVHHGLPILGVLAGDRANRHALANGIADESSNLLVNAGFLFVAQIAYQNPLLAPIWIGGLVWLARDRDATGCRFLAVAAAGLFALMVVTVGRPYYLEGIYPALFAAGATWIERRLAKRRSFYRASVLAATF